MAADTELGAQPQAHGLPDVFRQQLDVSLEVCDSLVNEYTAMCSDPGCSKRALKRGVGPPRKAAVYDLALLAHKQIGGKEVCRSGPRRPGDVALICSARCGCCERLIIGSMIATELRDVIMKEHGLTCSAGISYNKLLAKLGGGVNKPDNQTEKAPKIFKNANYSTVKSNN